MFSRCDYGIRGGSVQGLDENRVVWVNEEHHGTPRCLHAFLFFWDQHSVFLCQREKEGKREKLFFLSVTGCLFFSKCNWY